MIVARFLSKLRPVAGSACIEFTGTRTFGYGRFVAWDFPGVPSGRVRAHRYAYVIVRGPIPDGCDLDHIRECRNRGCCNAYHLEPVAHEEHGHISAADQWPAENESDWDLF
ncbi:MAG: HNH endonuclease signature motif containing protein [Planctomycetota bacterium]